MKIEQSSDLSLVLSYLLLRKVIGYLGIALPFVLLIIGQILFQTGWQHSISSYYYTDMRDVLVGTLIAFGVFLISYKGYEGDAKFGRFACVFAVGIALFPTRPSGQVTTSEILIGYAHLFFTAAFFCMLIYFCLRLFTKSSHTVLPPKKARRNKIFKICGVVMAICVVGIIIGSLLPESSGWLRNTLVFWLESIAIVAFGISWFTKGQALKLLRD